IEDSRIVYDDGDSAGDCSKLSVCGFPGFRVGDIKISCVDIGRCWPLKLVRNVFSSHDLATICQLFFRCFSYSLSCSVDKYCTNHASKCSLFLSALKEFIRKLTGVSYRFMRG